MEFPSLISYITQVKAGTIDPATIAGSFVDTIKKDTHNAFITTIDKEIVVDQASKNKNTPLCGAPIAIKDLILTKGIKTTCGSKILHNYIAPYSATCYDKLINAGMTLVGKTNLDEFAMGSSGESSYFGPSINPHGINRIPGGSSSGSAVAVAGGLCLAAIGTDTGGSCRQPAAMCGIVGCKPSYGRISRFGVQPMANSLDQVGTLTKTVADAQLLIELMAGVDPRDATSVDKNIISMHRNFDTYKIAIPQEIYTGLDPAIKDIFDNTISLLRAKGCIVDVISLPLLEKLVALYYILCPAEVSTNLSRFDGIKYGLQDDTFNYETITDYYTYIRDQGFGDEAKRRILIGTYVLSSAHYEGFYRKAKALQSVLKDSLSTIYAGYDAIITPTSPEPARKIGTRKQDPVKNYLADLYTIPANLAGVPALSLPMGHVFDAGEALPVGIQIIANKRHEHTMFDLGKHIESIIQAQ